jgi:chromosome segregation ATPase
MFSGKAWQVDQKSNQLNSSQRSITDLTSRLNSMESKINGIEKSQNFMSDQKDTLSVCTNANKFENSTCCQI